MFTQDKLENVYHIFKEEKVSEIRNEVIYVDSNNNILFSSKTDYNYKYFVNRYNYNHKKYFWLLGANSCISMRRELISDDVKYLKIAVDIYLTISAICKKEEQVLLYGKPLTYYRVHSQNSNRSRTLEVKLILMKSHFEDHQTMYNRFYSCEKELGRTLKFYLLNYKLLYYLFQSYLTDKYKKLEGDLEFSLTDKIFLLDRFNKPPRKSRVKYILASSFLLLPSSIRFHLFKFLRKHSNIVNKILEI